MAVGSVLGTGATIAVQLDFQPRVIELYNITGLVTAAWVEGMADASAVKRVTAGDMTVVTTLGVTPGYDSDTPFGFRIGADTDINVAAELIRWVAHE